MKRAGKTRKTSQCRRILKILSHSYPCLFHIRCVKNASNYIDTLAGDETAQQGLKLMTLTFRACTRRWSYSEQLRMASTPQSSVGSDMVPLRGSVSWFGESSFVLFAIFTQNRHVQCDEFSPIVINVMILAAIHSNNVKYVCLSICTYKVQLLSLQLCLRVVGTKLP